MCSFMSGMEFSAEKATNEGLEFGAEDNSGYSILSAGSLVELSRANKSTLRALPETSLSVIPRYRQQTLALRGDVTAEPERETVIQE